MTNREEYAEQILDIACSGNIIAMKNGKLRKCCGLSCDECDFYNGIHACSDKAAKWANSEYVEPPVDWSKVEVDTPILVRDSDTGKWHPRYFAGCAKRGVYAWETGATSWSSEGRKTLWSFAKLAESEDADA